MAVTDNKKNPLNPLDSIAHCGPSLQTNGKETLTALTSAALALPGVSSAQDTGYRSEDVIISYNHASYGEAGNRMDVDVDQFRIEFPIADHFEASLNYVRDKVSGASPVYNFPDANGNLIQVLEAGASIKDTRDVYEGKIGYYTDNQYFGFKTGKSEEDDYTSQYSSIDYRYDLNNKNTSIFLGIGYLNDDVWNTYNPVDVFTEPTVYRERRKREYMAGFSQILSKNSTVQFTLTHNNSSGFLSDPYKKVYLADQDTLNLLSANSVNDVIPDLANAIAQIDPQAGNLVNFIANNPIVSNLLASLPSPAELFSQEENLLLINSLALDFGITGELLSQLTPLFGIQADSRPNSRKQWIAALSYSHFLTGSNSAIHVDYRYADDDWGADSHTVDFSWKFAVGNDWLITPSLRYFSQHSADFYNTYFSVTPTSGHFSSDYRLAGFGALSTRFNVSKTFAEKYTVNVHYEYYDRQQSYELGSSNGDSIDNYHANILSFSIDVKL